MAVTTYTSYDQIRALLGVNDIELTDAMLGLEVYDAGLSEDLLDISEDLESDYALAEAASPRSAKEERLWRTTRLFASFSCAKRVGTSLSMFGPKDITDGKAGLSRFSDAPYRATMKNVEAEYGLAKQRLIEAYASYASTAAAVSTRNYFMVSTPTNDPVTG